MKSGGKQHKGDLEQGPVNCYNHFYWNTVTSTHLHIVCDCFQFAIAELSSRHPSLEKFDYSWFRYSTTS